MDFGQEVEAACAWFGFAGEVKFLFVICFLPIISSKISSISVFVSG